MTLRRPRVPTNGSRTAKSCDRRHTGIVPTGDELFVNELEELAFAHDGVAEIEAREFNLLGVAGCFERI